MQKVIKKARDSQTPVIIDKRGSHVTSLDDFQTPDIADGVAFTRHYRASIEHWRASMSGRDRILNEREQSHKDGYDNGFKEGVDAERKDKIKSIETLLAEAKIKSANAVRTAELKVIELASAIAGMIIRKSVEEDPVLVEDVVSDVLSTLITSEKVVLKVAHEDYLVIKGKYERWLNSAGSPKEFTIEIEKRLRPGDCLVETEGGIIDAVVSHRIDTMVSELLKVSQS